jgi:hypothetical protein
MAYMLAFKAKNGPDFHQFQTKAKNEPGEFLARLQEEKNNYYADKEEMAILEQNSINKEWFSFSYFKDIDNKVAIIANWVALKYKLTQDHYYAMFQKEQKEKQPLIENVKDVT